MAGSEAVLMLLRPRVDKALGGAAWNPMRASELAPPYV